MNTILHKAMLATATACVATLAAAAPPGDQFFEYDPSIYQHIFLSDMVVDRIEITQATQYIDHPAWPDNSIPALGRRMTTVRAYVRDQGSALAFNSVDARLQVYSNGNLLYDMLSDNGPIGTGLLANRNVENSTLNFTFLPDNGFLFSGQTLEMVVTVDPFDQVAESNEGNNVYEESKYFECRWAPRVIGLPINYQASSEPDPSTLGTPNASTIAAGNGDAFVWGIFPFPEYTSGNNSGYHIAGGPPLNWNSNIDSSDVSLLGALETWRLASSPVPDYVYGWFRGNPFWGNGATFLGTNAAFGNTDTTRHMRTFAHELGHDFGFGHTSSKIGETGWDSGDRIGMGHDVREDTLNDIMVPGLLNHQAWIHPDTYISVLNDYTTGCLTIEPYDPIEIEIFTGWWAESHLFVHPLLEVATRMEPPKAVEEGMAYLSVLGREGEELYRTAFNMNKLSVEEGSEALGFSVALPSIPGAESYQVVMDGEELGIIKRSPNSPRIGMQWPQAGDSFDEEILIAFDAADEDGDRLEATVRFERGAGSGDYIPLATRVQAVADGYFEIKVDSSGLPATEGGVLEVLVSDGVNTTREIVRDINITPDRRPIVTMRSPGDATNVQQDANLVLIARAHDPEDGEIDPDRIVWSSSVNGELGKGPALNVTDLRPGRHTISVVVTDSAGQTARDEALIKVR